MLDASITMEIVKCMPYKGHAIVDVLVFKVSQGVTGLFVDFPATGGLATILETVICLFLRSNQSKSARFFEK